MKNSIHISQEESELIERYLSGSMSAEERHAFDERLANEREWQQKLEEWQWLSLGVKEAALMNQMTEFHKETKGHKEATVVQSTGRIRRFKPLYGLLAAAVILGVVVVLFPWNRDKNQQLFSDYFDADPGLATSMGISDDYEFNRGMVDYKTGQYREAVNRWTPLLSSRPTNDTLHYFSGVALLALEQPDSALKHLQITASNTSSAFRSDAAWYAALALVRQNKKDEARAYLDQSSHPRKNELLSRLK